MNNPRGPYVKQISGNLYLLKMRIPLRAIFKVKIDFFNLFSTEKSISELPFNPYKQGAL
jgi:hypothetical protein